MKKISFILFFILFFAPLYSFAEIIKAIDQGGYWNDPKSWIGNKIPTEKDEVVINPKIKFYKVKAKTLFFQPGRYSQYGEIEADEVVFKKGAVIMTREKQWYNDVASLKIKANKIINNGEITYPVKLILNGNFINNGEITSKIDLYNNKKAPLIYWRGNYIENNKLLDDKAEIKIQPNDFNNKYYFFGKERLNISLNSDNEPKNYYFKSNLILNYFKNFRKDKIFLDDGKIFQANFASGHIVFPNKNKIIIKKNIPPYYFYIKIDAPKSKVFLEKISTDKIIADKIFIFGNTQFKTGFIETKELYIREGSSLSIGSGEWYSAKYVDLNVNKIINKGILFFETKNVIQGEVYNFGKIKWGEAYDRWRITIKGNLYNYENGEINKEFILQPVANGNTILNKGKIYSVFLADDTEFTPETTFNFPINSYDKKIILSKDTKFDDIFRHNFVSFVSKNGKVLNLEFSGSIKIEDAENFNLIFNGEKTKYFFQKQNAKYKKIINLKNSKLFLTKKDNVFGNLNNYYMKFPIINYGDLNFKTDYSTLRAHTSSLIENKGIIGGKVAFGFEDKRKFKYIFSENEVLTDTEKSELNTKEWVEQSIDLVPKLNEIGKKYFIHYILENETEEKILPLKKDIENIETNFSTTNTDMPQVENIPSIPEPQGDKTPPLISLNGNQVIELILGKSYTELGATARDDIDGDLTDKIQITSNVDTAKIGTYQVSYEISDLAGNKTKKIRVVKVVSADQIPPVITLNGDESIELKAGEQYIELGAKALDETDGDLTNKIKIKSNIDLTHTGIYQVKYSVSDSAGNIAEKIRVVKITEGNSSVGLPQTHTKSVGKSGKKSKRRTKSGKILYSCKDTRAINFSSIGKHKEELCVWKKKSEEGKNREKEMKTDFASQNPSKEKVDLASPNQPSMEEKNNQKQQTEVLKQQKTNCLNIDLNNFQTLKKWNKNKQNTIEIQKILKGYGYIQSIDGIYGNNTEKGVKEFQKNHNLQIDGKVGKQTLNFIIQKNCRRFRRYVFEEEKEKEKEQKRKKEEKDKIIEKKSEEQKEIPIQQKSNLLKKEKVKNERIKAYKWEIQEIHKKIERRREREKESINKIYLDKDKWLITKMIDDVSVQIYDSVNTGVDKLKIGLIKVGASVDSFFDKEEKEYFFKIYGEDKEIYKNKKTVIISHGLWSSPTDWVEEIASVYKSQGYQVLLVDWSDITSFWSKKAAWKVPNNIDEVAEKLKEKIEEAGIKKEKITLIGHSYGSLLSSVLSSKLGYSYEVIGLDPAASLIGTEYNINKNKNFPGFDKSKSRNTKCFVGTSSAFGSSTKIEKCDEQIYVDFSNVELSYKVWKPVTSILSEHSDVHKIYRDILKNNTLYNNILTPWSDEKISIPKGIISVNKKNQMEYLEVKNPTKVVYYGSTLNNEFRCQKMLSPKTYCVFAGWYNNDVYKESFFVPKRQFIVIKDFSKYDNDKLYLTSTNIQPIKSGDGTILIVKYGDKVARYVLEDVEVEKVEEWIKILNTPNNGTYVDKKGKVYSGELLQDLKDENPIQIE